MGQYRAGEFESDRDAQHPCCFTEGGQQYQVSLGFAVTATELLIYDRGIDPKTGKAIWGALLGPFIFKKCRDFATEL
ncbi:MAG: CpcT/CpeT family chromophore lyase [Spirulinaceae cyanobacterium]